MNPAEALNAQVRDLLRRTAADAIMPRFRCLRDSEIAEKSPGELVTVADSHAEELLTAGLSTLLPGSRVVGEEACADNPALLDDLGEGLVWIVDPIDGTANFAAGRETFGSMVALARDGVTLGAWILAPIPGELHFAMLGAGAFVAGRDDLIRPLEIANPGGRRVATLATLFMEPQFAADATAAAEKIFDLQPIPRCAAAHYVRLCDGTYQVALFRRTLPWDHAPGALILAEAGGCVRRWDGSPYRFADDGAGILAAANEDLWHQAAMTILNRSEAPDESHPFSHEFVSKADQPPVR